MQPVGVGIKRNPRAVDISLALFRERALHRRSAVCAGACRHSRPSSSTRQGPARTAAQQARQAAALCGSTLMVGAKAGGRAMAGCVLQPSLSATSPPHACALPRPIFVRCGRTRPHTQWHVGFLSLTLSSVMVANHDQASSICSTLAMRGRWSKRRSCEPAVCPRGGRVRAVHAWSGNGLP